MVRLKLNTKRFSTVASIWIQCTSGSLYTFSIYSPTLNSNQGYDQSTLDTVSVFKDIGANCDVLAGFLYTSDRVRSPTVSGPWVVHMVGAIQCFAGYFLMWAAVIGLIPCPPVAVMCLFMFIAAHAQSFFNTADVVTSVRNFPLYGGTAVGIMKGFVGLSGAILIQIYQTMFDNKPASYLLMLALLSSITPLLLMWFVKIYADDEGDEKKYLDCFSLIALVLAAYLMIVIILEHMFSFQLFMLVVTSVLMGLLVLPLFVAMKELESDSCIVSRRDLLPDESKMLVARQDPMGYPRLLTDTEDVVPYEENSLPVVEDFNLWQAMSTVNFWILFLAMACGVGSGLATVNNLSQVGGSLGYASSETSTLLSLWSIWNFLGRFGAGYVSDHFLQMKGWPRPLFMTITLASMSVGHVVIVSALPGALYAGSVLLGVCYGSQWSLMPTIASELFGVQHLGTIFNTITIASPVGSYIFSVRVVGYIYDKEALENQCTGSHCFVLSFLIMASATFLGSLAALGLFFRTKHLYEHVILRRIRHSL